MTHSDKAPTAEQAMRTEHYAVAFAYCCAEGGGSIEGCCCVKPDHGTAWRTRRVPANPDAGSNEWLKQSPQFHPGDIA